MRRPEAVLFDLWGTLFNSVEFDPRKGHEAVLATCENPRGVSLEDVMDLGHRVVSATIPREEDSALEFTQVGLLRMVSDAFGLRPRLAPEESEWVFWRASLQVGLIDGVRDLLQEVQELALPMGVVSNSSFAGLTLERELERQGIRGFFRFVISSADYGVWRRGRCGSRGTTWATISSARTRPGSFPWPSTLERKSLGTSASTR
jgi:FMN phosphatase YigB (HAD superfamily)